MKKALFKIIIPVCVLVLWMITCYPVCNKADGFDYFLYWILVGCPYGIRKMCMFLVPKNFGIAGSMGILALNCIVGGLIGGIIVLVRIIVIFTEIIKILVGHFWKQMSKGVREKRATKKALSINHKQYLLLVIWNIFHNIFNPAVEYLTEPVQNNGLYHHILPEPLKLCFVNTMVLNELVLTDVFSLKRLPKGIVFNHTGNSFPTLYFNGRELIIIWCV